MKASQSHYVACGPHELHVTAWGEAGRPALVMWHGLARTGRDFDEAAAALSDEYLVLCPDTLGRGLSSWADDAAEYSYAAYGDHAEAMFAQFGVGGPVRWIGTSMGGLVGVTLAAGRFHGRISHLVVNDIGPSIPEAAIERIAAYVGNPPRFHTVGELEQWLRRAYAPFGQNTDVFWRRMAETSMRRTDSGEVTVHYDPKIASQFTIHKDDLDIRPHWGKVAAKALLIRGAQSDVLPRDVADDLVASGPKPALFEVAGAGHAPTLASQSEIEMLREFLRG